MNQKPLVTYNENVPSLFTQLRSFLCKYMKNESVDWKRSFCRATRTIILEVEFDAFCPTSVSFEDSWMLCNRPYLHTYWVDCDVETYKACVKDLIFDWLAMLKEKEIPDWLIIVVVSGDNRVKNKLLRNSVYDRVKSDFCSKNSERCVMLMDPLKNEARSHESWLLVATKMRWCVVEAANRILDKFEEKMRLEREKRTEKQWNFCAYFLFQEELAMMYEMFGLLDDALIQYDELDALFTQSILNSSIAGACLWLEKLCQNPVRKWEGVCLCLSRDPTKRSLISQMQCSLLDMRTYLFGRQCYLLNKMKKSAELLKRTLECIHNVVQEVKLLQLNLPEGAMECWVYLSCMEVLYCNSNKQSEYNETVAPNKDDQNIYFSYNNHDNEVKALSSSLLDAARKKLKNLGELCGLNKRNTKPSSQQLIMVVSLMAGLSHSAGESKSLECLLQVLSSNEKFYEYYLEIAERSMCTLKMVGRMRSARLASKQLADFYITQGDYEKARGLLLDSMKAYKMDGWETLANHVRLDMALCYEKLDNLKKYCRTCQFIIASKSTNAVTKEASFKNMFAKIEEKNEEEGLTKLTLPMSPNFAVSLENPKKKPKYQSKHITNKLFNKFIYFADETSLFKFIITSNLPDKITIDHIVVKLKPVITNCDKFVTREDAEKGSNEKDNLQLCMNKNTASIDTDTNSVSSIATDVDEDTSMRNLSDNVTPTLSDKPVTVVNKHKRSLSNPPIVLPSKDVSAKRHPSIPNTINNSNHSLNKINSNSSLTNNKFNNFSKSRMNGDFQLGRLERFDQAVELSTFNRQALSLCEVIEYSNDPSKNQSREPIASALICKFPLKKKSSLSSAMFENKFKSQDDDEEDMESKKSDSLSEDQCNILLKKTLEEILPGENMIEIEHKFTETKTYKVSEIGIVKKNLSFRRQMSDLNSGWIINVTDKPIIVEVSNKDTLYVGVVEEINLKISWFKDKANITEERDYLREKLNNLVVSCDQEAILFETEFIKKLPSMHEKHNTFRINEDIIEALLGRYNAVEHDGSVFLESHIALVVKVLKNVGVSEEKINLKLTFSCQGHNEVSLPVRFVNPLKLSTNILTHYSKKFLQLTIESICNKELNLKNWSLKHSQQILPSFPCQPMKLQEYSKACLAWELPHTVIEDDSIQLECVMEFEDTQDNAQSMHWTSSSIFTFAEIKTRFITESKLKVETKSIELEKWVICRFKVRRLFESLTCDHDVYTKELHYDIVFNEKNWLSKNPLTGKITFPNDLAESIDYMQDEVFEMDAQIKPLVKGPLRLPSIVISIAHNTRDINSNNKIFKNDKTLTYTSNQKNMQNLSNQKTKINNNGYKMRVDDCWVYNESSNEVVDVVALTGIQVYQVPCCIDVPAQKTQEIPA